MTLILAGIHSLAQHLQELNTNPQAYCPERCPYCGLAGLWCHGYYSRHSDRQSRSQSSLNPIPIPRFRCPHDNCGRCCSVLPECIAPRRWYPWFAQQAMLLLLLTGKLAAVQILPHERTVWRWWARLKARFRVHRLHLANHQVPLGAHESARTFWPSCFALLSFSTAMFFIHQCGEVIP